MRDDRQYRETDLERFHQEDVVDTLEDRTAATPERDHQEVESAHLDDEDEDYTYFDEHLIGLIITTS